MTIAGGELIALDTDVLPEGCACLPMFDYPSGGVDMRILERDASSTIMSAAPATFAIMEY